jgi:non-ribosomal peptide synthase protein (TIGR01720 family)
LRRTRAVLDAVPNGGIGFDVHRYGRGDGVVQPWVIPDISFNYKGQATGTAETAPVLRVAVEDVAGQRSAAQTRSHALSIDAAVVAGRLRLTFVYCSLYHARETIETLARRTSAALSAVASLPSAG